MTADEKQKNWLKIKNTQEGEEITINTNAIIYIYEFKTLEYGMIQYYCEIGLADRRYITINAKKEELMKALKTGEITVYCYTWKN